MPTRTSTRTPTQSTARVADALALVLTLAGRGWPVFPLAPHSKHPAAEFHAADRCPGTGVCRAGHRGPMDLATTDPAVIRRYAARHPHANWAIAAGRAGLLVVDLDVAKPNKPVPADCIRVGAVHGAQMLSQLAAAAHASLPDTFTVRTPTGGTHLYYAQPAGARLGNTKGSLAGLIDTRGWGGYVVAPGSTTPDGDYDLIDDRPPAALPGWLARRLAERPPTAVSAPRQIPAADLDPYVTRAVEGEAQRVATAPPGGHNHAQRAAAAALGELVGAGVLDYDLAHAHLMQAAQGHLTGTCRCSERGVAAVFHSALRYGMRHPRQLALDTGGHDASRAARADDGSPAHRTGGTAA